MELISSACNYAWTLLSPHTQPAAQIYLQIYARNIDRNNSADGEHEANAGRGRTDTATRETYYNPDTSRRDVARDVLCGNSRLQAFPGFIAGSRWLTVYLHIVGEFRCGVTLLRERARSYFYVGMHFI